VLRAAGRPEAVALTFDDGPGPWTASIARSLEEHGCRGTFFLLGSAVESQADVVAQLAAAGHELGNHLWSHRDPAELDVKTIRAELDRTAAAIRDVCGVTPTLVRPPYCSAPRRVARAAGRTSAELVVLRTVDPADWRATSADDVVADVLAAAGPGDIVCLHDGIAPSNTGTPTREVTVAAVAVLVPQLLERRLRPVTVTELLQ
jgi:peptidoglycan/xylan/chitin deacetylase (PgdA/CDA1 family)